jgi:hypothetical protein
MARSGRATSLSSSFDLALSAAAGNDSGPNVVPRDPANAAYTNALAKYSL